MYSSCAINTKSTATSIFRPQLIQENYFPLRIMSKRHFWEKEGQFWNQYTQIDFAIV